MVRNTGLNIYPRQTENSDVAAVSCERFRKIWCERRYREEMFVGIRDRFARTTAKLVPYATFPTAWHSYPSHCFSPVEIKSALLFRATIITATFWLSTRHYCVMTFLTSSRFCAKRSTEFCMRKPRRYYEPSLKEEAGRCAFRYVVDYSETSVIQEFFLSLFYEKRKILLRYLQ